MEKRLRIFGYKIVRRRRVKRKKSGTLLYKKHKEAARALVHERLVYWNAFYNFTYASVRIKNTRTRWGSCSKLRNLNFNYRIVRLPAELADYLLVHELCHLKEMNHGPEFWALVAQQIPDYEARRKALMKERL